MGKRSKEKKIHEVVGRRRQMIQLDGLSRRSGTVHETEDNHANQQALKVTKVSGIGLLGAYHEDSDDSGSNSPFQSNKSQDLVRPVVKQHDDKMENELAGFLAEINAIGESTGEDTESKPAIVDKEVYDPENFDPITQGHLLPLPWQAVLDESSGYYYFWNCDTNEVQWTPPPAPVNQTQTSTVPAPLSIQSFPNAAETSTSSLTDEKKQPSSADHTLESRDLETSEEEERRKARSAKLSGLSKKERIRLLLEKNNINPDAPAQNDEISTDIKEDSDRQITNEKVVDHPIGRVKEEKSITRNVIASLVTGYDSDISDSEEQAEDVSRGMTETILQPNESFCVSTVAQTQLEKSESTSIYTRKQSPDRMSGLMDVSKANHAGHKEYEGRDYIESDTVECNIDNVDAVSDKNSISSEPVSENKYVDIDRLMDDIANVGSTDQNQIVDSDMKHTEDIIETDENLCIEDKICSNDQKDMSETTHIAIEENANYSPKKTDDGSNGSKENIQRDMRDKEELMYEEKKKDSPKKEFSVDIFAEESENEEAEKYKNNEEGNDEVGKYDKFVVKDNEEFDESKVPENVEKDIEQTEIVEQNDSENMESKDVETKKEDLYNIRQDIDKDIDKKSKERKKRKDHKEKKHERKDKESRKEKSHKKKHKERSERSEKSSRKLKEERRSSSKSSSKKQEISLNLDEEFKSKDEKRKEIEKEIELEERRRNEYEKSKKEEQLKEKERKEQEKQEIEEQKIQDAKMKEDAENEMHDFAEMLLEGALDTETDNFKKQEDQNEAAEDMEISDNEVENNIIDDRPPLPPMPPPDENMPCPDKPQSRYSNFGDEEMRMRISDLSITIFDKLEFLEVSRKGLTNFQVMLIEIETRMNDWREGALSSEYLLYRLEEVDAQICKYEETAAPEGWSCHWSSEHGMYYYYNEKTGESKWSYPTIEGTVAQGGPVYGPSFESTESSKTAHEPAVAPLDNYGYGRTNLMMWRSDLVENELSTGVPTCASKTTNPVAEESLDPYRDPYRDLTSQREDSLLKSPDDTYEQSQMPIDVAAPPPGVEDERDAVNPWVDGTGSGTTSPLPRTLSAASLPRVSSQASMQSLAGSDVSKLAADASYAVIAKPAAKLSNAALMPAEHTVFAAPALQAPSNSSTTQSSATVVANKPEKKKKEKRKKLTSSGVPSKKLKNVSSLVLKWQQVKKKVVEEMEEDSDEDEDPDVVAQKRIEEWKRSQLQSGKAAYNPNFEEIKGDWRERLKKIS